MDMKSLITWNGMPPEYMLEGLWYITINDYPEGGLRSRVPYPDFLDPFIQDVTIPQLSLTYKKTDFDLINFDSKDEFGSITLSFCDDINGTCLGFFDSWMNSIYDIKRNCLYQSWRKEAKYITAHLIRILKKSDTRVSQEERNALANNPSSKQFDNIEVKDVATFVMSGCLPKGIQEIELSSENGDRYTFSVEMDCETVRGYYRGRDALRKEGQYLMTYS